MKPERVVSIHFPKAGGTSLISQFSSILGEQVALDYGHDPLTPEGQQVTSFPIEKRVVHGHFRPQRYASAEAFWMTFLRQPISNLISIYYFWKDLPESNNPVHIRFLREQPSIVEFAKYQGITNLMSESYFGGFDMGRFNFIGFHETRENDIHRLATELDIPLHPEIHVNKTPDSSSRRFIETDDRTLSMLRDILAADLAFYERLRDKHG